MNAPRKDPLDNMKKAHWHETFNRQWELMHKIEEWMDVYIWEIDQETLKFANKKSRMILRLVYLLFEVHFREIKKYASKNKSDVTVQDVLNWAEAETS